MQINQTRQYIDALDYLVQNYNKTFYNKRTTFIYTFL